MNVKLHSIGLFFPAGLSDQRVFILLNFLFFDSVSINCIIFVMVPSSKVLRIKHIFFEINSRL